MEAFVFEFEWPTESSNRPKPQTEDINNKENKNSMAKEQHASFIHIAGNNKKKTETRRRIELENCNNTNSLSYFMFCGYVNWSAFLNGYVPVGD